MVIMTDTPLMLEAPPEEPEPSFASQAKIFFITKPVGLVGRVMHKIRTALRSFKNHIDNVIGRLQIRFWNWESRHPVFVQRFKFAMTWLGAAIGFGILMAVYLITFIAIYIGFLALIGAL